MVLTATASTSTSAGQQSTPPLASFRQLCHSLEAFQPTESKAALRSQLRDAIAVFKACGETFPSSLLSRKAKASSDSVTLGDGRRVEFDEQQKALHKAISQLHKIEESEVAVLLRIFFDSDDANLDLLSTSNPHFRSPLQSSTSRRKRGATGVTKADDDLTTSFFDAFTAFYFEERLYILRCISALIRIADDSFHDLHTIAREALDEFADQGFALQCLDRFQALCQRELVEEIREVPRYSVFWAKQSLREQLALLEVVFLLYYSRLDATATIVAAILNVIQKTEFGKGQACVGFFDAESGHLVDCIAAFLVILSVESLELEKCMEGLDLYSNSRTVAEDKSERALVDSPEVLGHAIDFLQSSTRTDVLRAPLLLSFALLLSRMDSASTEWREARPTEPLPTHLKAMQAAMERRGGLGSLWPDFVSAALSPDLDLFGTLNGIITLPLVSSDSPASAVYTLALSSSLALRAVFKGLVLSVTQLIRPEYIQDYAGLVNVWKHTFSANDGDASRFSKGQSDSTAALCAQFWETDFDHAERRAVLSMATRRFPVSFRPLLVLCQSLSGQGGAGDDYSLRACTAVLAYLAQVNTLAQVMPSSGSFSLPYEPVQSHSPSVGLTYRATRPINVFGKHLVVPAGTLGRMVSQLDQAPVVIVWEMEGAGYSAWRLIRDVLASFVGQLDTQSLWKASSRGRGAEGKEESIFQDPDPVANFSTLAPERGDGFDGEVATEAMALLSSILAGGRYLSATLLSHLQGDDVGIVEPSQPTSTLPKPTLVDVTLSILNQSLSSPTSASRLTLAAIRLLTLLIPCASSSIWQAMRSSHALTGSPGTLSFSSHAIGFQTASVSLLSREVASGQFAGLLALLDMHQALLSDLQQTQYSSSQDVLSLKVEVVARATTFIVHQVWPEYQSWKYICIRQQTEIGNRCTTFLDSICRDESFRHSNETKRLVELMDASFASPLAPSLAFAPLLHTLALSQRFIEGLQRGMRQVEAELARTHLEGSLGFASTIMHRQQASNGGGSSSLGVFASLLFDRGRPSSSRRGDEVVGAVARLTLMPHARAINVEAVKVMTCLCRATANGQASQAPTLIGHLGSLTEVERLIDGLLDVVDGATLQDELVVQTWNLLAAMVDTQPALATLLLTGRHLSLSVERQLGEGESSDPASGPTTAKSALQVASGAVLQWKETLDGGAVRLVEVLEGALKVLNVAWKHVVEHRLAFSPLRANQDFWSAVSQLAQADAGPVANLPPTTMDEGAESGTASRYALKRMCAARSLELLASDIQLGPQRGEPSLSLDTLLALFTKPAVLTTVLQSALCFPCDVLMHEDVLARLAQTFPEMAIDDFRVARRQDDFDSVRRFGNGYVYDIGQLQTKLQGFAPSVEEEMEGKETQSAALAQAVLLVAGLNLDWSIIDAQSSYLCAWTALLSTVARPLMERMEKHNDGQGKKETRTAALTAWVECAKATADEQVESDVTTGIHTHRVALLNILLKLAWSPEGGLEGKSREDGDGLGQVREAMEQLELIVTHPLFRIEDGVRRRALFPRHVFEMVHLAATRYRRVRRGGEARGGEVVRGMQQSAETFTLHTITCLRATMDNAWACISAREEEQTEAVDEDLALLTSILDILLCPSSAISPHVWAPRFQTTSLLSTAVDLFSRSPMQRLATGGSQTAEELLASGVTPIYSQSLLPFFFNLARHRNTAELLVLSGLINSLCHNALSSVMDSSQTEIPARLANTSYENPTHSCWVQMLRIVVALIANLDGPLGQRFIQTEAWSFFKVYEKKLDQSLDVRIRAKAGLIMARRQEGGLAEGIRVNQLDEVDVILHLYLHMIRAKMAHLDGEGGQGASGDEAGFEGYIAKVSVQLQESVHLLQHPRQLTALVGGGAKEEEERVKGLLVSSSVSIVASLWEIGKGSQVICLEPNDWDLRRTVIRPTISTTPTSASSTGTLLDLATYLVETILRNRDQVNVDFLIAALEQTASLCSTQLVLAAYARPNAYSTAVRKDLETGLGRDVKQGLESARGAMQAAGQSTRFLDVILAFHLKWLPSGD